MAPKSTTKKQEERKVVHAPGQWVERPRRTETLTCICGNRYIKTRKGQTTCVFCITRGMSR